MKHSDFIAIASNFIVIASNMAVTPELRDLSLVGKLRGLLALAAIFTAKLRPDLERDRAVHTAIEPCSW